MALARQDSVSTVPSKTTYNEPTVMWRLRHPVHGGAHAVIVPSKRYASALWCVRGAPQAARDFADWTDAITWLEVVCGELEAEGWESVERSSD